MTVLILMWVAIALALLIGLRRWFQHLDKTAIKGLDTLALALLVGGVLLALCACTTAPTANQQAGIQVSVDVATGFAIQQKDADPGVWKARAIAYKSIALQLQAINSAGNSTLATLAADLQPLIAKLPPVDQLAARSLVAGLTPYLNAQLRDNPTVAATQTALASILTEFILACETYGA